jgi:hypothetical protein
MKKNSLVICIIGHPGVLIKGEIYTVSEITKQGNVRLEEVEPPKPHTSFKKNRFIEIQEPMDVNKLIENIISLQL